MGEFSNAIQWVGTLKFVDTLERDQVVPWTRGAERADKYVCHIFAQYPLRFLDK